MKLNVDSTLFVNSNLARIGVILRDERGKTLLTSSMAVRNVGDPKIIELIAILRGIQLAVTGMGVKQL